MPAFTIGIDLGGTNLRIAAIDQDGRELQAISTLTEVSRGREYVITEIAGSTALLREKYARSHKFLGVGIDLPGWQAYNVRDDLAQRLDSAVFLDNDANCAALGEKWLGAGSHVDDLCMI